MTPIIKVYTILLALMCVSSNTVFCDGQGVTPSTPKVRKIVAIIATKPIEKQFVCDNAIYEIREKINLNGKQIVIPYNSEIRFIGDGGLFNGIIKGDKTSFSGDLIGVLDDIIVLGTFLNQKISSEVFSSNPKLESLINLVQDGGTIVLNSDVLHDGKCLCIDKSLIIDGNGHTIRIKNDGIKSGSLFEIKNVNSFSLLQLEIDGGLPKESYSKGELKRQNNFRQLISAENCVSILIRDCTFQNLFYQMAKSPDYRCNLEDSELFLNKIKRQDDSFLMKNLYNLTHYAMISFCFCKDVQMIGNRFENINSEEGVSFLADNVFSYPIKASDKSHFIAKNNKFVCTGIFSKDDNKYYPKESSLSSWITVLYGQCTIVGNEFGSCEGSQLNAFCKNSLIEANVFENSKSGSIDLNENGWLGFVPENIIVKNNKAFNTLYFVNFSAGKRIRIENNLFDCSGIPEGYGSSINIFAFFNRNNKEQYAPSNLYHPINNVKIIGNKSINAVWFLCDWNNGEKRGEKKGLIIDSNEIINRTTYTHVYKNGMLKNNTASERPAFMFSSFDNVKILKNSIIGTGCPKIRDNNIEIKSKTPSFITVIQSSSSSYFKNVIVKDNYLECDNEAELFTWDYDYIPSANKKRKATSKVKLVNNTFKQKE